MNLSIIRNITIFSVFLFPLFYVKSFAYSGVFPHAMFIMFASEILVLFFLLWGLKKEKLNISNSLLTWVLIFYIITIFFSGLIGSNFGESFWSSFSRMSGIVTWIHYFGFFIVVSSCFTEKKHWVSLFRSVCCSVFLMAVVSFLGFDGLNLKVFNFLKNGGSLLDNNGYSGVYYLLAFFISIIGYIYEKNRNWKFFYILFWVVIFFSPEFFNFGILNREVPLSQLKDNPSLILGQARASGIVLWFGLFSTLSLYLIHKIKSIKISTIGTASFFILTFFVSVFGFVSILNQKGKISELYINEAGPSRPIVWNMAVNGIKERPLFGYGLGNFEYVFQDNLDVRIISLETNDWFDKVHNFNLENLIETGVVGSSLKFIIFVLVLYISLNLYKRDREFYLLLIPLILFLNFVQLQVLFETDSGLFLIFLVLAFLVSHQKSVSFMIPYLKYKIYIKYTIFIIFIISVIFFILSPIVQNRSMSKAYVSQFTEKSIALYKSLYKLKMSPFGTLHLLSDKYMNLVMSNLEPIEKNNLFPQVAEEFKSYIKLYDNYLPRYIDNYRFLISHAEVVNTAFVFEVDQLKKSEDLLMKAITISDTYPYAFLLLSINLYYQDRDEEALMYAKKAYDLDPGLEQTKELMNLFDKYAFKDKKTFIYFNDI